MHLSQLFSQLLTRANLAPFNAKNDAQMETEIHGISLDSRTLQTGDLFIALAGKTTHGAHHIAQAIERGCSAILAEDVATDDSQTQSLAIKYNVQIPVIYLKSLAQHLPTLASIFYPLARKVRVIGITGTNGKTSVGFFIHQLLSALNVKNGFIGTLGITNSAHISCHTTPDIFTLYKTLNQYYLEDIHTAVLETSSHGLAHNRIAGLTIEQAIFTNLTQDHLDYHQTLDNYRQTKTQLFELKSLKTAIINQDDPQHAHFSAAARRCQTVFYSLKDFAKYDANAHGFLCQLDNFVFEISLLGHFNLLNILAAVRSVEQLGFERAQIIPLLPKLCAPLGRMQRVKALPIWVDYAHTPDSLAQAISTLKTHYPESKVRLIFGCGGERDQNKRAKMGHIAAQLADTIVLTNDNPRSEDPQSIIDDILNGINDLSKVEVVLNRQLAIATSATTLAENECLLIAGKGHETTQHIGTQTHALNDMEIATNATN